MYFRFPLEMHIVHKKVGEDNFLSVKGGLAVTGFFFEVRLGKNISGFVTVSG